MDELRPDSKAIVDEVNTEFSQHVKERKIGGIKITTVRVLLIALIIFRHEVFTPIKPLLITFLDWLSSLCFKLAG